MKHEEFRIGAEFSVEDRKFRCTDIGTRTIIAIRIDQVTLSTRHESGEVSSPTLSGPEAEAQGWFAGPPYAVAEIVFDEDDFEACISE